MCWLGSARRVLELIAIIQHRKFRVTFTLLQQRLHLDSLLTKALAYLETTTDGASLKQECTPPPGYNWMRCHTLTA